MQKQHFLSTLFTGKIPVILKTILATGGGLLTEASLAAIPGVPWTIRTAAWAVGFIFTYASAHAFHAAPPPEKTLAERK